MCCNYERLRCVGVVIFPRSCLVYHFDITYQPISLLTFRFFLYVVLKHGALLMKKLYTGSSVGFFISQLSFFSNRYGHFSEDTPPLENTACSVCLNWGNLGWGCLLFVVVFFCFFYRKGHALQQFIHHLTRAGCASTQLLFTCHCSCSRYLFVSFQG